LDLLNELKRHSLIDFDDKEVQIAHPTLRDYARRKLNQANEEENITLMFIYYYDTWITHYWIARYAKKRDQEDLDTYSPLLYKLWMVGAHPFDDKNKRIEAEMYPYVEKEKENLEVAYQTVIERAHEAIFTELERRMKQDVRKRYDSVDKAVTVYALIRVRDFAYRGEDVTFKFK
jgi:hypothetical protein